MKTATPCTACTKGARITWYPWMSHCSSRGNPTSHQHTGVEFRCTPSLSVWAQRTQFQQGCIKYIAAVFPFPAALDSYVRVLGQFHLIHPQTEGRKVQHPAAVKDTHHHTSQGRQRENIQIQSPQHSSEERKRGDNATGRLLGKEREKTNLASSSLLSLCALTKSSFMSCGGGRKSGICHSSPQTGTQLRHPQSPAEIPHLKKIHPEQC